MFGSIPVVDGRPAYDIREPEVENNHGGRVDGRVGKTGVTGRGGTDLMAKGTLSDAAWRQQCGVSSSLTRTVAISVLLGQVSVIARAKQKVAPPLGALSTQIRWPCASRKVLAIASPRSVPVSASRRRKRPTISTAGRAGRSSTSNVDSSNSRRICSPRSRAWARARFIPATARATGSMTAASTTSATQFSVARNWNRAHQRRGRRAEVRTQGQHAVSAAMQVNAVSVPSLGATVRTATSVIAGELMVQQRRRGSSQAEGPSTPVDAGAGPP